MSDFDCEYAQSEHYFGEEPEAILTTYLSRINPAYPVLDVGCGQGRNSFALARNEVTPFRVLAIDPSKQAVQTVQQIADAESLPIVTTTLGFEEIDKDTLRQLTDCTALSAILFFGLFPILTMKTIQKFLDKSENLLAHNGLIFITTFSTVGPDYQRHTQTWEKIDNNSFRNPDDPTDLRTYFAPDEILKLLDQDRFTVLHHREYLGPMHKHSEAGPLHQHAMIELVAKRQPMRSRI